MTLLRKLWNNLSFRIFASSKISGATLYNGLAINIDDIQNMKRNLIWFGQYQYQYQWHSKYEKKPDIMVWPISISMTFNIWKETWYNGLADKQFVPWRAVWSVQTTDFLKDWSWNHLYLNLVPSNNWYIFVFDLIGPWQLDRGKVRSALE